MKICVRAHDLGKSNASTISENAKKIGFEGIQFVINKAIENQSGLPKTMSIDFLKSMALDIQKNQIEVAMLGSYFNPVHSNQEKVEIEIEKFKEHLSFSYLFNCKYVGTETGSYNDDKWTYNPKNHTEEAFLSVLNVFKELAEYAKKVNANMAIEGAFGHCMHNPLRLKKLFDNLDNGHVFIIVDLYNYLDISNYRNQHFIFDECLELFKDKIVIFHLKDFIVSNDKLVQVGLGQGLMDFDYIIPKIKKNNPNAYLIFEGVKLEDMQSSYDFIKNKLEK